MRAGCAWWLAGRAFKGVVFFAAASGTRFAGASGDFVAEGAVLAEVAKASAFVTLGGRLWSWVSGAAWRGVSGGVMGRFGGRVAEGCRAEVSAVQRALTSAMYCSAWRCASRAAQRVPSTCRTTAAASCHVPKLCEPFFVMLDIN